MKLIVAIVLFTFSTPDGLASWYGVGNWHGSVTASGETFDPTEHTCAHRQYEFGTRLLVVNMENGSYASCRVNDRGPYRIQRGKPVVNNQSKYRRILDVTPPVAEELGMRSSGVVSVTIYQIKPQE